MTEFYASNMRKSISEYCKSFDRARTSGDWTAAHKAWLQLLHQADTAIREGVRSRIEADALASELLTFRPTRSDKPPAPPIDGHVYVTTAKASWVCAAVELRKTVFINAGAGYTQEYYVPERKTLCGKPVLYPVSERFTSGGWPRRHEMCSECTQVLAKCGLITDDGEGKSYE